MTRRGGARRGSGVYSGLGQALSGGTDRGHTDRHTDSGSMAIPCVELSNKMKIPALGLGTWQVPAGREKGGPAGDAEMPNKVRNNKTGEELPL